MGIEGFEADGFDEGVGVGAIAGREVPVGVESNPGAEEFDHVGFAVVEDFDDRAWGADGGDRVWIYLDWFFELDGIK